MCFICLEFDGKQNQIVHKVIIHTHTNLSTIEFTSPVYFNSNLVWNEMCVDGEKQMVMYKQKNKQYKVYE